MDYFHGMGKEGYILMDFVPEEYQRSDFYLYTRDGAVFDRTAMLRMVARL